MSFWFPRNLAAPSFSSTKPPIVSLPWFRDSEPFWLMGRVIFSISLFWQLFSLEPLTCSLNPFRIHGFHSFQISWFCPLLMQFSLSSFGVQIWISNYYNSQPPNPYQYSTHLSVFSVFTFQSHFSIFPPFKIIFFFLSFSENLQRKRSLDLLQNYQIPPPTSSFFSSPWVTSTKWWKCSMEWKLNKKYLSQSSTSQFNLVHMRFHSSHWLQKTKIYLFNIRWKWWCAEVVD